MKIAQLIGIFIYSIYLIFGTGVSHAEGKVNLYLFWGEGCPHCAKEKAFLERLRLQDDDITIHSFEVYYDPENVAKLEAAADKLNTQVNGVPFLVVGDKFLVGYLSDETTGNEIVSLISEYKKNGCVDIFNPRKEELVTVEKPQVEEPADTIPEEDCTQEDTEKNNQPALPKIGDLQLNMLSLPILTIVLGFIDGFNPCAMWVLLFLISLLLGMKDKKRMWSLGIAFIVSSAAVYFLFMVAWLNLFLFAGYIFWIRAFIALIAMVGGITSLRKFFSKDSSGCSVTGEDKRRSVFDKLGRITSNRSFIMALIGIMALAFAVNLVELVCSAGLPAVYTQVLALNNLPVATYYLYILLYILFFMLDDLFVFFVAMFTLQMTGITTKYVKWSRLIGGLIMIAIGFLLILKPELLMLG